MAIVDEVGDRILRSVQIFVQVKGIVKVGSRGSTIRDCFETILSTPDGPSEWEVAVFKSEQGVGVKIPSNETKIFSTTVTARSPREAVRQVWADYLGMPDNL